MNLGEKTPPDFPILSRVVNGHPLVYLDSGRLEPEAASR